MPLDLERVKLFQGMSPKELRSIEPDFKEVRHPAGSSLTIRGEGGAGFVVILEGEAQAQLPGGRERKLGPGDYFGEMALLDHEGRSATLQAVTDLRVGAIPEWGFKRFLLEHPEVCVRMLETLSRRLREAEGATAG